MRTQGQPTIQGYNAQAVATRRQIIVAAEIAVESPDFAHLEPAVRAALRELEQASVTQRPDTVLADAGYWHTRQMENIVSDGMQVLVPPDAGLCARTSDRAGTNAPTRSCEQSSHQTQGTSSTSTARPRSSRCSRKKSSTAGSDAFNEEAEPPSARNGACRPLSTTCSSSTTTGSIPRPHDTAGSRLNHHRPAPSTAAGRHLCPTATAKSGIPRDPVVAEALVGGTRSWLKCDRPSSLPACCRSPSRSDAETAPASGRSYLLASALTSQCSALIVANAESPRV